MVKVSVIIPIYGVEHFITRCAESLMQQTLHEVEFIFVNDATCDKSMEKLADVLEKYKDRAHQVRIVNHEKNKGLPAARNTGLSHVKGEYVFHCDGDDYLEPHALNSMYKDAKCHHADIIWTDWFLTFHENERYMKQLNFTTPIDALKAMLSGGMKYNVWNKLVKRSLYVDNHIEFPSGYGMGEDMTMMMLFAFAQKVHYLPKAFYHYVQTNTASFCQTYSSKHLEELQYNVKRISDFISFRFSNQLDKELCFFKLETKFPFLISNGKNHKYQLWKEWYPEANPYILQNGYVSRRSKLLQWCASKKMFFVVWLHYYLIMKLMYGILYK